MPEVFHGFTKSSSQFFRDLVQHNNKPWFDAHRETYEREVVGVMRALLESLRPFILKLNPQFEVSGKTNGNFSRINRDIRFSRDKSPYKSNFYLYFFDRNKGRDLDGRLYVGLSGEGLTVGFSVYGEWKKKGPDTLNRVLKTRLAQPRHANLLSDYLRSHGLLKKYETYWYAKENQEWTQKNGLPRTGADWERLMGWVVRKKFSARDSSVRSKTFLKKVERIFSELYPLYLFSAYAPSDWIKKFRLHTR